MTCPSCGSSDVFSQQQTNIRLSDAHHGIVWWLLIGWWWVFVKWFFFTGPALFFKIFGHKKQRITQSHYTVCTCQSCGYSWKL